MTSITNNIHRRLQIELPYFSMHALKIRTKPGDIIPFIFNKAQTYLHFNLEEQLKTLGRVRMYVLKGRQQGCSTYVAARYYHKATRRPGQAVFILSHEAKTTAELFEMVKRYHEYCPEPLRPETRMSNQNRMMFDGLDSKYLVGTAGTDSVGRGGTYQMFHGSEVALWAAGEGIKSGVMQAVPDLSGTENILESTARGPKGMFYDGCMQALRGEGDYQLTFIPWYWQEEYQRPVTPDFFLTDEETELATLYQLSPAQLNWRRIKIFELQAAWLFKQEYPNNVMEAFQSSGVSLLAPHLVQLARKTTLKPDLNEPIIAGFDPARRGDRKVIVVRQGRKILFWAKFSHEKTEHLANDVMNVMIQYKVDKLFMDFGLGYGIFDMLRGWGLKNKVQGIHFGESASDKERYANKRAEMGIRLKEWFESEGVDIPDNDEFAADMLLMPDFKQQTSNRKVIMPSKEEVRKLNNGISPDVFDALSLTFAFPVKCVSVPSVGTRNFNQVTKKVKNKAGGPLKTRARVSTKPDRNRGEFWNGS